MSYRIFARDPALLPFEKDIQLRMDHYARTRRRLVGARGDLLDFANGHEYFGFHKTEDGWVYREWAPAAEAVYLTGDMVDWRWLELPLTSIGNGVFEIRLPGDALYHGCHVKAIVKSGGQLLERIPLYTRRVEQDPVTYLWCGVIVDEPDYVWKHGDFVPQKKSSRPSRNSRDAPPPVEM